MTSTYPPNSQTLDSQPPPTHRLHGSSDRLPTSGFAPTPERSPSLDNASHRAVQDAPQKASDYPGPTGTSAPNRDNLPSDVEGSSNYTSFPNSSEKKIETKPFYAEPGTTGLGGVDSSKLGTPNDIDNLDMRYGNETSISTMEEGKSSYEPNTDGMVTGDSPHKASMKDKVVGTTKKVAGKLKNDSELFEKGEMQYKGDTS